MAILLVVRCVEETRDAVAEEPLGASLVGVNVSCVFRGSYWGSACAESALWMLVLDRK
jgi:hypothetical protein